MNKLLVLITLVCTWQLASPVFAQTISQSDADRLFDFAELSDADLFAPSAETEQIRVAETDWFFRSYADSGIIVAVNINGTGPFFAGDVFVLGGPFGQEPVYIDTLPALLYTIDVLAEDDDNDGVVNAEDQCAGTPEFESVDASGCSLSQLDDDSDGVNNARDSCPATAPGVPVTADGCSAQQLGMVVSLSDANRLFDYAESAAPWLFGPATSTQEVNEKGSDWFIRYYAFGVAIKINRNGVGLFVAGNVYVFGGPYGPFERYVDTLANLVAAIDSAGQ